MLSAGHLFLIFLIVLLFFGAKRLPEIARAMGKAVNEFKKAKDETLSDVEDASSSGASKSAPAKPADEPVKKD